MALSTAEKRLIKAIQGGKGEKANLKGKTAAVRKAFARAKLKKAAKKSPRADRADQELELDKQIGKTR